MKRWYESTTVRSLIVSAIAQGLSLMGVTDGLEDASKYADSLLNIASFGSLIWAYIGRARAAGPLK